MVTPVTPIISEHLMNNLGVFEVNLELSLVQPQGIASWQADKNLVLSLF
jgi:hypothetical protein